jgi:predicted MFS family arabinose efflux permease
MSPAPSRRRLGWPGWSTDSSERHPTAGLLASFVAVELRAEEPITPLRLLASSERNAALLARLLTTAGMFGMFFFLTVYLQGVLNYSPLQTGFAFVPMSAAVFFAVRAVPKALPRFGPEPIMIVGSTLALAAMAWLTQISAHSGFLTDLVGPMVIFGLGAGMSFMPLTVVALNGVAPADTGAASGLVNVMQQLGGALGLAILVTVFGSASRTQAGSRNPALSAVAEARHDLASAIATSFVASTALLVVNLMVVVLFLGRRRYLPAAP